MILDSSQLDMIHFNPYHPHISIRQIERELGIPRSTISLNVTICTIYTVYTILPSIPSSSHQPGTRIE